MFFGGQHSKDDEEWEDQGEQTGLPNHPTNSKEEVNTTEFYELLQITKDATTEQVKKAFRRRALKEHPDKGGDPDKFKRLKEAYDTLIDPEKRQLYDQYGEEGVKNGGPGNGGFNFFPHQKKNAGPQKTKPKLIKIDVTLEEVFSGTTKEVTVTRYRTCTDCQGKGGVNAKTCPDCSGTGIGVKLVQLGPGMYTQAQAPCEKCNRLGVIMSEEDKCKICQGKRVVQKTKIIEVAIEQGVPDSHDYIFYGESDQYPGALAGDVYVRVNLANHEYLQRRGADLIFHKEITLLQALTGVTTTIKLLGGKQYIVATAPGQVLENKQLKTLRGLGMPFYKDSMSYGNLYFEFKVVFPPNSFLNASKAKLLRQVFTYKTANPQDLQQYENAVPLEDYNEQLLNPKAGGGNQEEEEEEAGHGQPIGCQQQ